MRICLVGTLPETEREVRTGPERTTIGLAEALQDRGHEVTVIADEGSPETVETEAQVLEIESPPGVARVAEFAWRARATIDRDGYDAVHTWRSVFDADILSLHSIGMAEQVEEVLPGTFSRRFLYGAKLERYAKRFTSMRTSKTVVTAPKNYRDAERFGLSIDEVVPVGVDESFLRPDLAGKGPDVFCLGRIEPRKQQHFVAAETPETYSLRLAGPRSDDEYARRVPNLDTLWDGKLTPTELERAYQTASVFVLPSVFEGFGLTAVEAMAAGTPVVVADTCGVADFVSEHDLGAVYRFGDGDSYRRALETVFADRDSYADRAKSFVEDRLLWSAVAESYENMYESVRKQA